MLSPEMTEAMRTPVGPLLAKEIRDLLAGRAFWVLLLLLSPLVGYGFQQAVLLYAEASRAAVDNPALARGLSPLDGVVVPTFGALYLATTFLFPFVAIRTIGAEKQNGGQKLLLQLPYPTPIVIAAKGSVLMVAWLAMALPCLSALVIWSMLGGHLNTIEVANVALGHFLYASVVAGIGLAAASLAESSATAAILALSVTLGFWVLDFAAAGGSGILHTLSALSLTAILRGFERGIFSASAALTTIIAALGLAALAGLWWRAGRRSSHTLAASVVVSLVTIAVAFGASHLTLYADASEDRRNSFDPVDMAALRQLDQRLTVIVKLALEDPRYIDFANDVLGKLRRTIPDIEVIAASEGRSALFAQSADSYGEITYRYAGREATSRSTGAGEVLPVIYELARIRPQSIASPEPYPGHPLVADPRPAALWFYLILPVLVAAAWLFAQRGRFIRKAIRP